eukprot:TRINITY_DN1824_c0_g1_i1.p1 TRINITY_DN1824_c0_g1~~TRINITY_DN1824_c0_g1_i1.p1  ORF type:complete len:159 (+),score=36.61 TRINITY_DN1824_c0_g1_i1:99-575(+)
MALIEDDNRKFLLLGAPEDPKNLNGYLKVLKKYNVKTLVRVCEKTYDEKLVEDQGIKLHDWPFEDGGFPSQEVIDQWLTMVDQFFKEKTETGTIGVHCIAGLGRAPLLIGIALIENGMDNLEVVNFIREKRKAALSSAQLNYLVNYNPRKKKRTCVLV